jgi:TRAP-type mannitol/chloroaromatic compound transport system permease small subunit
MKWIKYIDRISERTGRAAAWLVVPLTLLVTYEVVMRDFFNQPSNWGYDVCWMIFGLQFMIGGAYTLLHKGHVRIDIVYNVLPPRAQKIFDSVVYIVFFLFVTIVFTWAGIKFAADAWMSGEYLSTSTWKFPSAPIKTVIPVAYFLLSLQSLAELIRCLSSLRKGGIKE